MANIHKKHSISVKSNKKIQKSTYTTMNNDVRASKKSHGKITYTVCLATVSYPSDGYAPSSH